MKYAIITILILISCNQNQPYGTSQDISELKSMLFGSRDSWNTGSIKGFMSFYSNDSNLQFIGKNGRKMGWNNVLNMYMKSFPDKRTMGHLDFELDTVEILSSMETLGHITGKWKLTRDIDTPGGFFSLITKKTSQGPKIIIDHTW